MEMCVNETETTEVITLKKEDDKMEKKNHYSFREDINTSLT